MDRVRLECARGPEGTLRIALAGDWRLARGLLAPGRVVEEIERSPLPRKVVFETGVLSWWDSGLLTFLLAVLSRCAQLGVEVDRLGLPEGVRRLLALATAVPARPGRRNSKLEPILARVGDAAIRRWNGLSDVLAFIGDAFPSLLRCLAGKARFRWSDFLLALQDCGARSLPIVALINLLVGLIFNFHGYPSLIHRLTYRRTNHAHIHVRGYKEKGNINTPLDLAIQNQIDRFSLAMDVIDRVPSLQRIGAHAKEELRNRQLELQRYAYQNGIDDPEIDGWTRPHGR